MGAEIINFLGGILINIAATITWIGGSLLDSVVIKFVLQMGELVQENGGFGEAIEVGWKVIRDLSNIIFIAGFVYVGIKTILDNNNGETKRFLTTLIIAALLINFSLFFTRAIIDVANVFTFEVYELMSEFAPQEEGGDRGFNIAAGFMRAMGLVDIFNPSIKDWSAVWTNSGSLAFYIGASIFLVVTGIVFAAGAIMLLVRFAFLLLFMTFSPVFFSLSVFPQTANAAKSLWKKFISYAFFAPLYMFFIYISFKLISTAKQANLLSGNSIETMSKELTNNSNSSFQIISMFFLIICFMVISLVASSRMGAAGANTGISALKGIGNKARSMAGSMTLGTGAAIGRSTIGRYYAGVANDKGLKERAANGDTFARAALGRAQYISKASFDTRRIAGVGNALKIGEGKKGGYKARLDAVEKKEKDFAKSLGTIADDDPEVMKLQSELDIAERVQDKVKDDQTATSEDKAAAKRNVALVRQKLERERNRLVLGSESQKSPEVVSEYDEARKELSKLQNDAAAAVKDGDSSLKNTLDSQVFDARKRYQEAKEKYESATGGLVGTLKNRGFWRSLPTSRNKNINVSAGKALEKEFLKKTKKDKDDLRTDAIVEAASKKDD